MLCCISKLLIVALLICSNAIAEPNAEPTAEPTTELTAEPGEVFIDFSFEEEPSPANDNIFHRMEVIDADIHKAYCLDGSPSKYYLKSNTSSTEWVIMLEGNKPCGNDANCFMRSLTGNGSSKSYAETSTFNGILSLHEKRNARFRDSNLVLLKDCDGMAYSAALPDPVNLGGKDIYFRGRMNVARTLTDLWAYHGLGSASKVIIGGDNAGGQAMYMLGDWIAEAFAETGRSIDVKLLIGCSFKPDQAEVDFWFPDKSSYDEMDNIWRYFLEHGAVPDSDCYYTGAEAHKCIAPQFSAQFISTPKYIVQNILIQPMTECAVNRSTGIAPGSFIVLGCKQSRRYPDCDPSTNGGSCANGKVFNDWATLNYRLIGSNLRPQKDGAFLVNCFAYYSVLDDFFQDVMIRGVRMGQAIQKWVDDTDGIGFREHFTVDRYNPSFPVDQDFFNLNPTCPDWPLSPPE